jgi:surfactin synthase thioesterase subunit
VPDSLWPQPIQLPGRENRIAEPPTFDTATVADALRFRIDRPYVLYGHSMGAVLAVELARELASRALRRPERLYLAASCPPHVRAPSLIRWRGLADDELLAEVDRFCGLPASVLALPKLRARLITVLRSDLDWLAARADIAPQPVGPIVTIAGDDDAICPARLQTPWSGYSTTPLRAVGVPGGHLFHMSNARGHGISRR